MMMQGGNSIQPGAGMPPMMPFNFGPMGFPMAPVQGMHPPSHGPDGKKWRVLIPDRVRNTHPSSACVENTLFGDYLSLRLCLKTLEDDKPFQVKLQGDRYEIEIFANEDADCEQDINRSRVLDSGRFSHLQYSNLVIVQLLLLNITKNSSTGSLHLAKDVKTKQTKQPHFAYFSISI